MGGVSVSGASRRRAARGSAQSRWTAARASRPYALRVARDSLWALAVVAAGIAAMAILLAVAFGLGSQPATSQDPGVVPLPTSELGPGMMCNAALLEGELVVHPDWGVAVRGYEYPIFWPLGYVGRSRGDLIEVLNPAGDVVARIGDVISAGGGGNTIDGVEGFKMCPHGPSVIQAGQP